MSDKSPRVHGFTGEKESSPGVTAGVLVIVAVWYVAGFGWAFAALLVCGAIAALAGRRD